MKNNFFKQDKIDRLYLRMAFIWSENSYAVRRKVGCLIVKNNSIISDGYNGTPSGFPNVCESVVCKNRMTHRAQVAVRSVFIANTLNLQPIIMFYTLRQMLLQSYLNQTIQARVQRYTLQMNRV